MRKKRNALITLACAAIVLAGASSALAYQDAAPPTISEATGLMQAGQFEQAADAFQQILESDPDNATAWFNLGYSLHMAGELEQALRAHRKAATYEQFEGIALYNVACALALLGDTDGALEALTASRLAGFDRIGSADTDSDLDSIRDDPRYEIAMGRAEAPEEVAEVHEAPAAARPHGSVLSPQELAAARQRLPQLFQTVAEHMQPILEDLAPTIEVAANELMQQAMMKAQQLAGQLQQMVMEDEQLVSAIEEIHHTLTNDPEFMAMVGEVQQWIQQRMGGGVPVMQAPPAAQVQTPVEAIEDSAEAMPTLSDAQDLQQAGDHVAAAHAFAMIRRAEPDNAAAAFGYAYNLHMSGAHEEAIAAHKAAAEFEQVRGISLYNLACAYALTDRPGPALEALRASLEAGFDVASWAREDSDLDSLRDDERFIQFMKDIADG